MARRLCSGRIRPLCAVTALLAAVTTTIGIAGDAGAASRVDVQRLWGADRYATAVEIAEAYVAEAGSIDTVIVASGETFVDALAATPLARVRRAPILLSPPDGLHPAVRSFIERHQVRAVIIAGGTSAVSSQVERQLADAVGGEPERLHGADRYQTVVNIASQLDADDIGEFCGDGRRTALLATGERFADALSLSPLAYAGPHPVLLSRTDRLSSGVRDYLDDYAIEQVLIAGGSAAVADSIEAELDTSGIAVTRIWGQDRYETAAQIARALADRCFESDEFGLAYGRAFPDAMVGGALLGLRHAPLLLVDSDLPDATRTFLSGPVPDADTVALTIFGGTAAVSESTVETATDALAGIDRRCDSRTDARGVPRDVTVRPLDGGLEVRWSAPASLNGQDPSGYRIRHRPLGGQWITTTDVESPATLSGLTNTILYEVQVRADGAGYETWSPSSFATPSAAVSTGDASSATAASTGTGAQAAIASTGCPPEGAAS